MHRWFWRSHFVVRLSTYAYFLTKMSTCPNGITFYRLIWYKNPWFTVVTFNLCLSLSLTFLNTSPWGLALQAWPRLSLYITSLSQSQDNVHYLLIRHNVTASHCVGGHQKVETLVPAWCACLYNNERCWVLVPGEEDGDLQAQVMRPPSWQLLLCWQDGGRQNLSGPP